jgi:acetoin utilization protein AcuB
MHVDRIMSRDVVTIKSSAGLEEALGLMKEHDIRHLPVVQNGRLLGLVTERDVRGALFPSMLEEIRIRDLMIRDPFTVRPDMPLEEAARIVYRNKIGCLPVVDDRGRVVGIVTVADMLAALIEVMGFLSASSRLDVRLPDDPEALGKACRIIQQEGGRIINITLTQAPGNRTMHLFRLQKMDVGPIVKEMERAGFEVDSSLA